MFVIKIPLGRSIIHDGSILVGMRRVVRSFPTLASHVISSDEFRGQMREDLLEELSFCVQTRHERTAQGAHISTHELMLFHLLRNHAIFAERQGFVNGLRREYSLQQNQWKGLFVRNTVYSHVRRGRVPF
jgi:hypothetical protein